MDRKPQIKATLPPHVATAIEEKSALIGDTKAEYLAEIAKWWFGQGCPPVTKHEEQLRKRKELTK